VVRYIIRRLLWAVVLFIAVTLATYLIFYIIPVNPARLAIGKAASPSEVKTVTHQLYLDRPIYIQYLHFLWQLVGHHSLGYSFANRQSVNSLVLAAAPITISLVLGSVVVWMAVAVPVGVYSALHPRTVPDRIAMVTVLAGISVHPVWLSIIAIYLIGYLPTTGHICGGPWDWFHALILPWCVFAFLYAAFYVRMIRSSVMETLGEDYVRTARAKGAPERQVLVQHVLRNAMLPVVTMLGMDVALALGGAILIEQVFSLPGLGYTAIHSLYNFDYPVTLGVVVFGSLCVIVLNLLVDLLYAWIDPRIRLS
jgi:peptide/nickel transport system permease protein